MDRFEQIVDITPAYDKRTEGYGTGSAVMTMILRDRETKQAVQFKVSLGWYLPGSFSEATPLHWKAHHGYKQIACESADPMAFDLGYHSLTPRYEEQSMMSDKCEVTEGVCYYDGSSLNAYDAWKVLVAEGHKGLWRYLEDYYLSTLETPKPEGKDS